MATNPITKQELIDAATDAETLESVANDAPGVVIARKGRQISTVSKVIQDLIERYYVLNFKNAWATLQIYSTNDIVEYGGAFYICLQNHTSGVFNTDLNSEKWGVFNSNSEISFKSFGGKADGVSNDTTAFSNFIDYLADFGGVGILPEGEILTNPVVKDFTGKKAFCIKGAGKNSTVIRNLQPSNSFIYLTAANGVIFEDFTLDGDFTAVPTEGSGGNLVFVNSNNITLRNLKFIKFRRVAVMAYNDHQTNLSNIYKGLVFDALEVLGNSNFVKNVGPSALLVADYDNSVMRNCYIENIGQYGYEWKNDCNNNIIENCVAVNTYKGIYYGGSGVHSELGYVKNSTVANCILVDCDIPIVLGLASNNTMFNIESRTTLSGPTPDRATIAIENSNSNRLSGIHVIGRKTYALDIRNNSFGNSVEFSLSDGAYIGEAVAISSESTGNRAVISWKNHDSSILNILRFQGNNNVSDVRGKYFYRNTAETNPRIEDALTYSRPSFTSTVKGRVQFGNTFDVHTVTAQPSLYENFGDYANPVRSQVRHKFDTGSKVETLYSSDMLSSVSFVKDQIGFYPGSDNTLRLGGPSSRWTTVYAASGTIDTSDERLKTEISEIDSKIFEAWAEVKFCKYKFKDSVEQKGNSARWHFGLLAQKIVEIFEKHGLNAFEFGIVCFDEWHDEYSDTFDEEGNKIGEVLMIKAGNRYGVRYEEALALETAYIRYKLEQL